jgi:iron-sulfur cluster repair protein YtfE (RIC family)
MLIHQSDTTAPESLTPEGLCNLIEFSFQQEIQQSGDRIRRYLNENEQVPDLSDSVSDLVHMLFKQLSDEVDHLFLKEAVIIFPCIKHHYNGNEKVIPTSCVDNSVYRNIQGTHKVILNLLQRLRQVLDSYALKITWSKEWRDCLADLSLFEKKIFEWIHVEQRVLYPKINQ